MYLPFQFLTESPLSAPLSLRLFLDYWVLNHYIAEKKYAIYGADSRILNELLKRIGWSRAEFARRARVHRSTVDRWQQDPPYIVLLYLQLVARSMNV